MVKKFSNEGPFPHQHTDHFGDICQLESNYEFFSSLYPLYHEESNYTTLHRRIKGSCQQTEAEHGKPMQNNELCNGLDSWKLPLILNRGDVEWYIWSFDS